MKEARYKAYIDILKEELRPALGCTEPIAVAYAAALAARELGRLPKRVEISVSGNIIKNVKSVIVPNTGGMRGLPAAAAAGIVAGDPDKELEVIARVTDKQKKDIADFLEATQWSVREAASTLIFDIQITLFCDNHSAVCRITDYHTNVVYLEHDGCVLWDKPIQDKQDSHETDRSILNVEDIVDFAENVEVEELRHILDPQITFHMEIAREGLEGKWGARIGQILLETYGDSVLNRAKAWAAAASDARMNGCDKPVIINSGSGNQGITASVPVIVYAEELDVSDEIRYRALAVSNLVTIHLKTGIGRLSAYCGVVSAGCGAGAGITYLYGGRKLEIAHTIVNALAINSGVICDGAKSSCAAKIASAVEAGILGMEMYRHGSQFYGGDGIVTKGVENTIRNVGRLAREGMAETDKKIIDIMMGCLEKI